MGGLTGSVDKLHLNLVIGVRILIKGLGTHYTCLHKGIARPFATRASVQPERPGADLGARSKCFPLSLSLTHITPQHT